MYMRQTLRLCHALPVRKGAELVRWTRDTHLRGSRIHFSSQFRRLSDNPEQKAHRMSKKALILIADGTEEMEL